MSRCCTVAAAAAAAAAVAVDVVATAAGDGVADGDGDDGHSVYIVWLFLGCFALPWLVLSCVVDIVLFGLVSTCLVLF